MLAGLRSIVRSPGRRTRLLLVPVLAAGLAFPAGAGETTTLAEYAETFCIPGASPLPLDLFSLGLGEVPLGDGTVTVRADPPGGTATLCKGCGDTVPLEVAGFGAIRLLLPNTIDFDVDQACDAGGGPETVTFTFNANLGIALDPEFLAAASEEAGSWVKIDGGEPVVFGPVPVGVEVRYTAGGGPPQISFTDGAGGGGAGVKAGGIELPLALPAGAGGFMIGSTGVVVEAATLQLLTAKKKRQGFALGLDGVRLGFGGLLSFLNSHAEQIHATGIKLERGGLSGRFTYGAAGCAADCFQSTSLLGNTFCFRRLDLSFQENAIIEGLVCGGIQPPFFADHLADCGGYLDLELALGADGEARVAFTPCVPAEPPLRLGIADIFSLTVTNLDFELDEGGGYLLRLDGDLTLDFIDDGLLGGEEPLTVAVRGLTITSGGDISLDGGWVRLPEPVSFQFQGFFEVTIKGISFGRDATDTWIGLDADVNLMENLPLGGSVQGFRVMWPNDDARIESLDVDLGGIAIDFRLPGVATFEGAISWDKREECFSGHVLLNLEAINFAIDATLLVGKDAAKDFRYFFVTIETELPAGIPIFAGVSLYGLEGLFASNMVPGIDPEMPLLWYREHQDWDGSCSSVASGEAPWRTEPGALTFGAGALIGTPDDGFAVHAKATLLISIPGPLISFEGKANLVQRRESLLGDAPDPIFHAYAIYSPDLFEIGVGVNYELASVIEIRGDAAASFNLMDPSEWHIYLGNVSGRQIEATIVEFLRAKAFYMIHPEECDLRGSDVRLGAGVPDLAFGASVGFDEDYSAGPLGIALRALIAGWAAINFAPIHFQGGMDLDGLVELRAFGFSLGIATQAALAFQTPTPFVIDGLFRVALKLPWPLPDPRAEVHLHFGEAGAPDPVSPILEEVSLTARDGTAARLAGAVEEDAPIVELDAVPNLIFRRPMNDRTPSRGGRKAPGYLGAVDAFCLADVVRREGEDGPGAAFAYYLRSVSVAGKDLVGGGGFDDDVPQPDGVWLPEPRKLRDPAALEDRCDARAMGDPPPAEVEFEDYPSSVLALNDLNPFLRMRASDFVVQEDGGGGGGGAGGGPVAAATGRGLAGWIAAESCAGCDCFPCERPPRPPADDCRRACVLDCAGRWEAAYKHCRTPGNPNPEQCRELADREFEDCLLRCAGDCTPPLSPCECPPDAGWVPDESEFPCVWLPYKVYKIEVTTEAWSNPTRADGGDERKVECETGDSILGEEMTETRYFKTQGPPLDLTPYVHEVLPASATRPFFRRYDPAVRFKTNYIRELYTLPGRDAGVKVCEGEPGLIARLLDSSRNFLSECDVYFTKAEDHVEPLYDGSGVPGPDAVFLERQPEEFAELYRDDILHVDCDTAVLRPGERHVVQIVWRDPRLRDDLRFDPDDPEVEEVVVLEFPLLASRFEWLDEVFRTFLDDATCPAKGCSGGAVYRGTYFELEVPKGANWGAAAEVLDELADAGSVVGPFAARLRDAHPTAVPGEVDDQTLRVWLAGVERPVQCLDAAPGPGCDEKVLAPADALGEVREAWEHERAAFDRLDRLLRLERHREPLPGGLEVSVLESDGEWMGFLLEFPEPLDLSRITIFPELDGASPEPPLRVVKDAPGARIFLFSHEAGDGGGIFPPGAGEWRLSMVLQGTPDGELDGWRVTGLRRGPGPQFPETPAVCFHLGTDLFGAPCPE